MARPLQVVESGVWHVGTTAELLDLLTKPSVFRDSFQLTASAAAVVEHGEDVDVPGATYA